LLEKLPNRCGRRVRLVCDRLEVGQRPWIDRLEALIGSDEVTTRARAQRHVASGLRVSSAFRRRRYAGDRRRCGQRSDKGEGGPYSRFHACLSEFRGRLSLKKLRNQAFNARELPVFRPASVQPRVWPTAADALALLARILPKLEDVTPGQAMRFLDACVDRHWLRRAMTGFSRASYWTHPRTIRLRSFWLTFGVGGDAYGEWSVAMHEIREDHCCPLVLTRRNFSLQNPLRRRSV